MLPSVRSTMSELEAWAQAGIVLRMYRFCLPLGVVEVAPGRSWTHPQGAWWSSTCTTGWRAFSTGCKERRHGRSCTWWCTWVLHPMPAVLHRHRLACCPASCTLWRCQRRSSDLSPQPSMFYLTSLLPEARASAQRIPWRRQSRRSRAEKLSTDSPSARSSIFDCLPFLRSIVADGWPLVEQLLSWWTPTNSPMVCW